MDVAARFDQRKLRNPVRLYLYEFDRIERGNNYELKAAGSIY